MAFALQALRTTAQAAVVACVNALLARLRSGRRSRSSRRGGALIVGGDATQRRYCETLLQALGVRVDVAGDGFQAQRALASGSFGLVIVDGAAPGLDAAFWTRLRNLVAMPSSPRVYVVTDRQGGRAPAASPAAALRAIPRPVRALSLVEAAQGLR